jgi:hypothetical protein
MRRPVETCGGIPYPMTVAPWEQPDDDLSDEFQAERETDEDDEEVSDDDPKELW